MEKKKKYNEATERRSLEPMDAGTKPPISKEGGTNPDLKENIISFSLQDVPDLSGKKAGDKISLQVDGEIANIDNDNVQVKTILVKDINKGMEEQKPQPSPDTREGAVQMMATQPEKA